LAQDGLSRRGERFADLRELAELAAGSQNIPAFALADEGRNTGPFQDRLKPQDRRVVRPLEWAGDASPLTFILSPKMGERGG